MSKSGVFVCVCRCMGCMGCMGCMVVCSRKEVALTVWVCRRISHAPPVSVCGSGTGMDNILIRAWQVDNEHLEQRRTQLSGRRKASGRTQFMRDNYTNSGWTCIVVARENEVLKYAVLNSVKRGRDLCIHKRVIHGIYKLNIKLTKKKKFNIRPKLSVRRINAPVYLSHVHVRTN